MQIDDESNTDEESDDDIFNSDDEDDDEVDDDKRKTLQKIKIGENVINLITVILLYLNELK